MKTTKQIRHEIAKMAEHHLDELFRFAFFRVGNRQEAEDIVQEAIVRLLAQERPCSDVRLYLMKSIANLCVDYKRRRVNTVEVDQVAEPQCDPQADSELQSEYERINRALECLTQAQREIVMMRAVDSLSFAEIAHIVEAPATTVQSRYRSALKELQSILRTN